MTDSAADGYWEAARRGELRLQRCVPCRHFIHFPQDRCPFCGVVDWTLEAVSGTGTVVACTTVHRAPVPDLEPRVPFQLAWVDLPEQAHLRTFGEVIGARADIGDSVTVCFEQRGELTLPCWRLP